MNELTGQGIRFNRSLGQNFISDPNLLSAIVSDAGVGAKDTVVEIGAGAGALSKALAAACKRLITFEIDKNLKPVLTETLRGLSNVELIFGDIMKFSAQEIDAMAGGEYKVVANMPYYITSPVITNFVENSKSVTSLTLMMQKEVSDRLTARAGKDYGALTVAVQAAAHVKITRIVGRQMFFPAPNVESALVKIDIDRTKYDIPQNFKSVIRCAFAMRRKTLQNNLSNAFGLAKEQAGQVLAELGVSQDIRGEALSVPQFVRLAHILASIR